MNIFQVNQKVHIFLLLNPISLSKKMLPSEVRMKPMQFLELARQRIYF